MKRFGKVILIMALSAVPLYFVARFVIGQLELFFSGTGNIVIMLVIYSLLCLIIDLFLLALARKKWLKSFTRKIYWVSFAALLIFELLLRQDILGNYKTYAEQNGDPNYTSMYSTEEKLKIHYGDLRTVTSEFNYLHTINSLGFRDREYSKEQLDSSYVVLFFGDGFVEGYGAPDDSTWSRLVMNDLAKDSTNVICLNGGYTGSDPFSEYYKLKQGIDEEVNPDMVIVTINSSDIVDVITRGDLSRFETEGIYIEIDKVWWEKLYSMSFITRILVHEVFNFDSGFKKKSNTMQLRGDAVQKILSLITNELVLLSEASDFQLVILLLAVRNELEAAQFQVSAIDTVLMDYWDIIVINHLDAILAAQDCDFNTHFWPIDNHFNSLGNSFIAMMIYGSIKDEIVEFHHGKEVLTPQ